jgi:cytochrome c556
MELRRQTTGIRRDMPLTTVLFLSMFPPHRMEICNMNRKWLAFPMSAGILIVLGIAAGPGLLRADDDESPLEKIMEKVNKHNSTITKGTRTKVAYAKNREDVEKSAKELVKLAKAAKPIKDAVAKAKGLADPQKKWDLYMDELIKSSQNLGDVTAKEGTAYNDAKSAFATVKKACADCHKDFRVEEGSF